MQRLPERIDAALGLAAAGALALLVSLFLDWYEPGLSAIDVFEITDLLLAGLAIGAIAIAVRATTVEPGYEDPRTDWLAPLGIATAVIVLWEIVDNPPAVAGADIAAGAWIGLIGALAIAAGAVLWTSRVSLVLTLRPREGGEPSEPAPAIAPLDPVDDPDTGEEDVIVAEPYEPEPPAPAPASDELDPEPASETVIEPRTEQQPAVERDPRSPER